MIELVTVLGILITLSYFALPALEVVQVRSREKLLWKRLFAMRRAIDRYAADRIGQATIYPTTIRALLEADGISGPLLAGGSVGNPFSTSDDEFLWDIRDGLGNWHNSQNSVDNSFAEGIFDVRYPEAGVNGWQKAMDGTNYDQW